MTICRARGVMGGCFSRLWTDRIRSRRACLVRGAGALEENENDGEGSACGVGTPESTLVLDR